MNVLAIDPAGATLAMCFLNVNTMDMEWATTDWTRGIGLNKIPTSAFASTVTKGLIEPFAHWFDAADVILIEHPYINPSRQNVGWRLTLVENTIMAKFPLKARAAMPKAVKAWISCKNVNYAARKKYVVDWIKNLSPLLFPPLSSAGTAWAATRKKDDLADALMIALWYQFSFHNPQLTDPDQLRDLVQQVQSLATQGQSGAEETASRQHAP